MNKVVYTAKTEDWIRIKRFAKDTGVHLPEPNGKIQFLLMADKPGELAAIIGIDTTYREAVLRSLVIDGHKCKSDDVFYFLNTALAYASEQKASAVYFATPAGSSLFTPLGFEEVEFSRLPEYLKQDWEKTYTNYPQEVVFLMKKLCT
ncbi:hypothetical protein [Scopulibacillus cellulosilyticus]|uniref:N-acetyltransferase domain-containing protein n=1 Tax=Scopulibacillus cellulosilyticus TaxID=2665665 RepID=A0ABW2PRA2_9BACL